MNKENMIYIMEYCTYQNVSGRLYKNIKKLLLAVIASKNETKF